MAKQLGNTPKSQEALSLSHPLLYEATSSDVLVDFDGPDDPYRPMNWPLRKKIVTTVLYGLTTGWVTFASAVYSAGIRQIAGEFRVNTEAAAAGVSLIVFGFAFGPLVWAPLSEVYGRKWVVLFVRFLFSFCLKTDC